MRISRSAPVGGLVGLLCLTLLVGCGEDAVPAADETDSSDQTSAAAPQPETQTPTTTRSAKPKAAKQGTRIVARESDFGTILFDDGGQAIYIFDVEKTPKPQCYGSCAQAWPPVYAQGEPRAGGAVRTSLLGTTDRRDGRAQVTYDGHPLYYYAHEGKGEVKCHDVFLNGGNWYAVMPDGDRAP